ncbi:STAS domain-containing protein [Micromonospora lupini]|uniref:STAS domain-containing protein n=1 Tax=Micromonospora lupini TaxID=285679 RepID=UPI002252704C|nr:STAS domain-containing protein [Micromonospora lupini]MCX5064635.1 STAS domain-containing protein [Micromonospora lupini]
MSHKLLTIEVTRLDACHVRLRLTGELDYDTAPDLVAAAAELHGEQHVTIDLAGVGLCDSSGLSALLVVHRRVGAIRLTGVSARLQQMLDRTGLTELLAVETAVAGDNVRALG